jgi:hypothetical protein
VAAPAAQLTHPESPRRVAILFVVAVAVIGGFLVNVIVNIAVARRRRVRVDAGRVRWQFARAAESDRSPIPAPYPGEFEHPTILSGRQGDMVRPLAAEIRQVQIDRPLVRRAA